MEQKQQIEYKLIKLIDGTELVGQISVSNNDKFLRIEEPLQLKTVPRATSLGVRDDSSLAPWLPFSTDKIFSIPKERVIEKPLIGPDPRKKSMIADIKVVIFASKIADCAFL